MLFASVSGMLFVNHTTRLSGGCVRAPELSSAHLHLRSPVARRRRLSAPWRVGPASALQSAPVGQGTRMQCMSVHACMCTSRGSRKAKRSSIFGAISCPRTWWSSRREPLVLVFTLVAFASRWVGCTARWGSHSSKFLSSPSLCFPMLTTSVLHFPVSYGEVVVGRRRSHRADVLRPRPQCPGSPPCPWLGPPWSLVPCSGTVGSAMREGRDCFSTICNVNVTMTHETRLSPPARRRRRRPVHMPADHVLWCV